MNGTGEVRFDHLVTMTDERGLFEHALGTERRREHGYCTDDNARLLVLASRERDRGAPGRLGHVAFEFVLDAQAPDGRFHNRMSAEGAFTDRATTHDCWGRAVWALGVAARRHTDADVRRSALAAVERSLVRRSVSLRSMSFAALGAADVAELDPGHRVARALLADVADATVPVDRTAWPWPERRLAYANAVVPEALIAAGVALERPPVLAHGLRLLRWLVAVQLRDGHLSMVGQDGRGPRDGAEPQFDQQAIEVSTLADACWRAYVATGDGEWVVPLMLAAAWFDGANDRGLPMVDPDTGGGYDGLQDTGVNLNQGAESTMAAVSTVQRVRGVLAAA